MILSVAIVAFGILFTEIFPLPIPSPSPKIKLSAYIRGDYLFIEHRGGEAVDYEKIDLIVRIGNSYQDKPNLIEKYNDGRWECGEYVLYPYTTNETVSIKVIEKESNTVLLYGSLQRGVSEWIGVLPPLLISSLRTNTTDEDLTCYSLVQEGFNPVTFIYNWKKDGVTIYEMLLSFDTQSGSITRDYSGNGYNSTVDGATWVSAGKIGGAYFFDGVDDGIVSQMPLLFGNWSNNFTISLWIYSMDIESDNTQRCIFEVYRDSNNSMQMFQYNSSIYCAIKRNGSTIMASTPTLKNNTWYHVAVVYNGSTLSVYTNGTMSSVSPENVTYENGDTFSLSIGRLSDGRHAFYGYIDEFYVCRLAKTPHQIHQDYMDMKDGNSDHRTIVADETRVGETWSCTIIPNDLTRDGDPIESNILTIISYGGGAP